MATQAAAPTQCPSCQTTFDPERMRAAEASFCPNCRFPLVLIAGKYRLERLLNQGGFGMLYLARHVGLDLFNERVIKVLKPELFEKPTVLQRFRREVQLTANLSEQNNHIVRIYDDFGHEPTLGHYYIMEYLRGLTLEEVQGAPKPLEYGLAFHIFYQLCKAMGAAHRAGVIHRDLKPDNIFLIQRDTDPHFVKVIDFGLARPDEDSGDISITHHEVMGTPAYMSPEQCQNQDIDTRSDIYAMGIILYQMLCGRHPFPIAPTDTMALFFAHVSKEPTPIEAYDPSYSGPLWEVLRKSMAKDPNERYAMPEDFWQALAPFAPAGTSYPPLKVISRAPHRSRLGQGISGVDSVMDPAAFDATMAGVEAIPQELAAEFPTAPKVSGQTPTGPMDPLAQTHREASGAHSPLAPTDEEDAFDSAKEEAFAPTMALSSLEAAEAIEAEGASAVGAHHQLKLETLEDDDDRTHISPIPGDSQSSVKVEIREQQLDFDQTSEGAQDPFLVDDDDDDDMTTQSVFAPPNAAEIAAEIAARMGKQAEPSEFGAEDATFVAPAPEAQQPVAAPTTDEIDEDDESDETYISQAPSFLYEKSPEAPAKAPAKDAMAATLDAQEQEPSVAEIRAISMSDLDAPAAAKELRTIEVSELEYDPRSEYLEMKGLKAAAVATPRSKRAERARPIGRVSLEEIPMINAPKPKAPSSQSKASPSQMRSTQRLRRPAAAPQIKSPKKPPSLHPSQNKAVLALLWFAVFGMTSVLLWLILS